MLLKWREFLRYCDKQINLIFASKIFSCNNCNPDSIINQMHLNINKLIGHDIDKQIALDLAFSYNLSIDKAFLQTLNTEQCKEELKTIVQSPPPPTEEAKGKDKSPIKISVIVKEVKKGNTVIELPKNSPELMEVKFPTRLISNIHARFERLQKLIEERKKEKDAVENIKNTHIVLKELKGAKIAVKQSSERKLLKSEQQIRTQSIESKKPTTKYSRPPSSKEKPTSQKVPITQRQITTFSNDNAKAKPRSSSSSRGVTQQSNIIPEQESNFITQKNFTILDIIVRNLGFLVILRAFRLGSFLRLIFFHWMW
jgi:hypothetical protein